MAEVPEVAEKAAVAKATVVAAKARVTVAVDLEEEERAVMAAAVALCSHDLAHNDCSHPFRR